MKNKDFAVFILSHGRPSKIKTIQALQKGNYTGKYYIIIDNEDTTSSEYYKLYNDKVIMFDKLAISKKFDTADTFLDRRTIVYARNACFDIAKKLGLKYFLELDDDYTTFEYRKIKENKLIHINCKQLDKLFDLMIDFLEETGALTVALSQGGDFLGGEHSTVYRERLTRKAMNTFFCKTENRFDFVGRINEDVNTYTSLSNKGKLFFTIADADIQQTQTQSNSGGMTDVYLDSGTYLKSFYSVIFSPQAVKIGKMGENHLRLHHKVSWNYCAPKILNEKYKKTKEVR